MPSPRGLLTALKPDSMGAEAQPFQAHSWLDLGANHQRSHLQAQGSKAAGGLPWAHFLINKAGQAEGQSSGTVTHIE